MSAKDADGMANSVDPDQQSDLGLHCLPRPNLSENLGLLRYVQKSVFDKVMVPKHLCTTTEKINSISWIV